MSSLHLQCTPDNHRQPDPLTVDDLISLQQVVFCFIAERHGVNPFYQLSRRSRERAANGLPVWYTTGLRKTHSQLGNAFSPNNSAYSVLHADFVGV
jgi:hypothetical protein